VNPAFFCYSGDFDPNLAAPTGMVIAGRSNWYFPGLQAVRTKGAELYSYLDFADRPDAIKANEPVLLDVYMGDPNKVPLWGNNRVLWPGTHMADVRPGSAWTEYCLGWCERLIKEGKVDGLFLDVLGSRPWGKLAAWETWPESERADWTASVIDFVKELDRIRRRVNDRFKIINNNFWHLNPTAEQYVDGVCFENNPTSDFHTKYARRAFGSLGQRRVLVIGRNAEYAADWLKVAGPTHITTVDESKGETYLRPTARTPGSAYEDLRPSENIAYIEILKGRIKDQEDEYDKLLDDLIKQTEDNKLLKDRITNAILDLGGIPSGQ
jgi:hypothetical protein